MAIRKASAVWEGSLKEGKGRVAAESGLLDSPYSFTSRFEQGQGTNPEELIAAAHAGCFSMALAHGLSQAGHQPKRISTEADVQLDKVEGGFKISKITLNCQGEVPDIDADAFQKQADEAKTNCPVSKALAGVEIELKAELSQ